jgi:pantetheine-phosphate adenylyltransferase
MKITAPHCITFLRTELERSSISAKLKLLGFDDQVLARYEHPHREYHNSEHLLHVLAYLEKNRVLTDDLFLAAVYHDSVYDPRSDQNEELSGKLFATEAGRAGIDKERIQKISRMILDTKKHVASFAESQKLIDADLEILNQPLDRLIAHEKQIYREYQFMPDGEYREMRIKALQELNREGKLDHLIAYVQQRKPFIGLFCGSFKPFHRGHYNVLQKAEKIFDKVIIAFGKNPEKNGRPWDIPATIKNRQIGEYHGLLTDFVLGLGHDVVIVRGLRNSTDFQYEQNQYRYLQELMPAIRIVNIFCDKEFEHISSSGIRTLEPFGKHRKYLLE